MNSDEYLSNLYKLVRLSENLGLRIGEAVGQVTALACIRRAATLLYASACSHAALSHVRTVTSSTSPPATATIMDVFTLSLVQNEDISVVLLDVYFVFALYITHGR